MEMIPRGFMADGHFTERPDTLQRCSTHSTSQHLGLWSTMRLNEFLLIWAHQCVKRSEITEEGFGEMELKMPKNKDKLEHSRRQRCWGNLKQRGGVRSWSKARKQRWGDVVKIWVGSRVGVTRWEVNGVGSGTRETGSGGLWRTTKIRTRTRWLWPPWVPEQRPVCVKNCVQIHSCWPTFSRLLLSFYSLLKEIHFILIF